MRAIPNTWATIRRGTQESPFGDIEDAGTTVVARNIPISLLETRVLSQDPVTLKQQSVLQYVGRLSPTWATVDVDDRIVDENTGAVYQVSSVQQPPGPTHANDVRLVLHRVV